MGVALLVLRGRDHPSPHVCLKLSCVLRSEVHHVVIHEGQFGDKLSPELLGVFLLFLILSILVNNRALTGLLLRKVSHDEGCGVRFERFVLPGAHQPVSLIG